ALGYAEEAGLELEHALIRNHYIGRTFIHPAQQIRSSKVKIKFNPVREVLEGKKVVVVDDSLVRGTTSKELVQMIRQAGAREVHFRVASAAMRDILGGKGAGLAEMANLGLPVPPGFTLSAKLCLAYIETGDLSDALRDEVARNLKQLERAAGKKFGDRQNPLLVSVRSGAAVSMPGMM